MKPVQAEMRSAKDLESYLSGLLQVLDGKETEHNWKNRDNSLLDLARVAEANGPQEFHQTFVGGIKALLDGIVMCLISERTTLSNHACDCVRALARNLGPSIHPMLDYLLPALIKLCAYSKPISSRAGNETVREILNGTRTYNTHLLHHISSAFTTENSAPRIYAPAWLETLIKLHGPQIDHSGGLRQVEEALKRSLGDPNSKARENSRSLYWAFAKQWPSRAEYIMSTLEPQRQKALQDDPNNPNKTSKPTEKYERPKSSLAEAKAQAKKKLQVKQNVVPDKDGQFIISLDNEKPLPNPPPSTSESKKAPVRLRNDATPHAANNHIQALQPILNPSTSSVPGRSDGTNMSSHSKSGSIDSNRSQESQGAQRSRPLMAAPVRRAVRVVSNTTPAPVAHPHAKDVTLPVREAKPPTKPVSIDMPSYPPPSRSPVLGDSQRPESRQKSRSKPEAPTRVESPAASQVLESREKAVEEFRRKPAQSKELPPAHALAKLQHALKKVRNLDFAPIGFTRLRRLVEANSDALAQNKNVFDDVVTTMLLASRNVDKMVSKHLQEQPEDAYTSLNRSNMNVKKHSSVGEGLAREYRFAITSMIQSMLAISHSYFTPYYCKTMQILLHSRGFVEDKDHKVKDLEEMASNIVMRCDQLEMLGTIFEIVEPLNLQASKFSHANVSRTLILGLQCLRLSFATTQYGVADQPALASSLQRGVELASSCSKTTSPRIRKASVELCVVLQQIMGEQAFDDCFQGEEGTKNMIAYYANKAGAIDGDSDPT